ncbi:26851_t:CDS:2, partial [Gigaspora margarita]
NADCPSLYSHISLHPSWRPICVSGNVINFLQDMQEFANHLLHHPSSLNIIINNIFYQNIEIANDVLLSLPENGSIIDQLLEASNSQELYSEQADNLYNENEESEDFISRTFVPILPPGYSNNNTINNVLNHIQHNQYEYPTIDWPYIENLIDNPYIAAWFFEKWFKEVDYEINEWADNSDDDDSIEEIAYFTKSLTARHIQFSAISVEYPSTDTEGYAILYNFIESENYSQIKDKDNDHFQKTMRDKARVVFHRSSNVNCLFFDEPNNERIQIIKDQKKYGGFKICLFAHEHIMNNKHTNIDFDSNIFQTIKNAEALQTFPHIDNNGNSVEANLIYLLCDVTFYRLTPIDLIKCPFVVLVSVGEHTHPPPPPSHIPESIKDHIKLMINTSEYLDYITSQKIISSN